MVSSVVEGINAIINAANSVGNMLPGYSPIGTVTAPQIPQLATGAVIPPNAKFAAILGDQKSGTNIEAPIDLIRQVVAEALQQAGVGSGQSVSIEFTGSLAPLIRELHPLIKQEDIRRGGRLITGTV
jgi:hypothetical protein